MRTLVVCLALVLCGSSLHAQEPLARSAEADQKVAVLEAQVRVLQQQNDLRAKAQADLEKRYQTQVAQIANLTALSAKAAARKMRQAYESECKAHGMSLHEIHLTDTVTAVCR